MSTDNIASEAEIERIERAERASLAASLKADGEREGFRDLRRDCGACIYWQPIASGSGHLGRCAKSPPVVVMTEGNALTVWPRTTADEWCGGFASPKPRARP